MRPPSHPNPPFLRPMLATLGMLLLGAGVRGQAGSVGAGDQDALEAESAPQRPGILLPESPAARAFAGCGPDTAIAAFPAAFRALDDDAWKSADAWRLWGELVAAEHAAEHPDAERRAQLCLLARRQGREIDAWRHYATLTASPSWAATALPYLMPGIPAAATVEIGGRPAPLPNGVILRPLPPPAADPRRPFHPRSAEVFGLRIGRGEIHMLVSFESSGLEIKVRQTGGEPVEVSIVLPEPEGLKMGVEYTDWTREDDIGQPRPLTLRPGEETLSLYGRFQYKDATLPTGPVARIPEPVTRGGLTLEGAAGSSRQPLLLAAAATLASLLDLDVRVRDVDAPGTPGAPDGPSGITVHLGQDPTAHLSYLATRVEEFLLRSDTETFPPR